MAYKSKDYSQRYSAFDTAVYFLTFKARTKKELTDKLREKGYSDSEIIVTLEKLSEYNYLNDESYALSYIKENNSKKGKKLITRELKNKGIDNELLANCFDEICIDEEKNIEEIFNRKFSDSNVKDTKEYRRIVAYFLRRGFSYEDVKKTVLCHFA